MKRKFKEINWALEITSVEKKVSVLVRYSGLSQSQDKLDLVCQNQLLNASDKEDQN